MFINIHFGNANFKHLITTLFVFYHMHQMEWYNLQRYVHWIHNKTPHEVTVLWPDSDYQVTTLLPTNDTDGRLPNQVSVPPWFLHSDGVYRVPSVFPHKKLRNHHHVLSVIITMVGMYNEDNIL